MSNKTHRKAHQGREHKRQQFSKPARRTSSWLMLSVIVGLLGVIAYLVLGRDRQVPITTASARTVQVASGESEVRIPLSEVNSGQAKFFDVTLPSNTSARFFVIKTSDGVYRAALDACEVCFGAHKGYYQDGDQMVCRKCGRHFSINTVNNGTSGCHPVGLSRRVEGEELVIPTGELQRGAQYFQVLAGVNNEN